MTTTTITTAEALDLAGRRITLAPEVTRALRGARVLVDGVPATIEGVCSCGCDAQLQWVARYGVYADLERFIVQTDAQRAERMAYTCVPAARLAAL